MKRYYVCADVHSYFDEMITALSKAGFDINNPDHVFISCGDLFDRGNKSKECLDFVNGLPSDRKILIRGNHEDLLEDVINRKSFTSFDYTNGTVKTIFQLTGKNIHEYYQYNAYELIKDIQSNRDLKSYYDSLLDYCEIGDYIFVHGWIPETMSLSNGDWGRARWANGFQEWSNKFYISGKTIVCGHWHCSYANFYGHNLGSGEFEEDSVFSPFVDNGIICMDSCVHYTGFLNCILIEDNKVIYVSGDSK